MSNSIVATFIFGGPQSEGAFVGVGVIGVSDEDEGQLPRQSRAIS